MAVQETREGGCVQVHSSVIIEIGLLVLLLTIGENGFCILGWIFTNFKLCRNLKIIKKYMNYENKFCTYFE